MNINAPFPPTDISLKAGRVPPILGDGSSLMIPGFHAEVKTLEDVDYVDDDNNIFLNRLQIAARKSPYVLHSLYEAIYAC